jgi:uncharacterized glyoxalase superfamily protein PhnB
MSRPSFPELTHVAPVLVVDRVEPCIAFWVDRFGFEATNHVPGDDGALCFASVVKNGIEIMYQTRASVLADNPDAADTGRSSVLFFTVPSLNEVERAVSGAPVVKPRHDTPYGSTEIYVREPGGHMVGFAEFTRR